MKQIIPVAEFVSTSQTMDSISEKLYSIKNILTSHSVELAPLICTDNSWTLIGAVMKAFNGLTTSLYINWCYDVLVKFSKDNKNLGELREIVNTRLVICSVHYLKNFIKEVKKNTKNKTLRHAITFSMSLLQECHSLEDFNKFLFDIFNIFSNQTYAPSVSNSLKV